MDESLTHEAKRTFQNYLKLFIQTAMGIPHISCFKLHMENHAGFFYLWIFECHNLNGFYSKFKSAFLQ